MAYRDPRVTTLRGKYGAMMGRCYNTQHRHYDNYGARGISVCADWHVFSNFVDDLLPTFYVGAYLDRIDNNADYSPENVRWVSSRESVLNRRCTTLVTYNGVQLPVADLAPVLGLTLAGAHYRVKKFGSDVSTWPPIKAYRGKPTRDVFQLLSE
jgi:hypothetical protein